MKTKKQRSRRKTTQVTYTHRDSSGMAWRMVGSRPVSALADKVMADCGMKLR